KCFQGFECFRGNGRAVCWRLTFSWVENGRLEVCKHHVALQQRCCGRCSGRKTPAKQRLSGQDNAERGSLSPCRTRHAEQKAESGCTPLEPSTPRLHFHLPSLPSIAPDNGGAVIGLSFDWAAQSILTYAHTP